MQKIKTLKEIFIFSHLPDTELEKISYITFEKTYPKYSFIFLEGEKGPNFVYFILSGSVKLFKMSINGKEKILDILSKGEVLGEIFALNGDFHTFSGQANENVTLLIMPKINFIELIQNQLPLNRDLLKILINRLTDAYNQVEDLCFRSNPGKVASLLLRLTEKFGVKVDDKIVINKYLTHLELATMVGIARETLTKILKEFREERSVDMVNHTILILDKEKLKNWI